MPLRARVYMLESCSSDYLLVLVQGVNAKRPCGDCAGGGHVRFVRAGVLGKERRGNPVFSGHDLYRKRLVVGLRHLRLRFRCP